MAKDPEYRRLLSSVRWLRLRKQALSAHPCCMRCESEGRVSAATEVHHRVPVETAANSMEKQRLAYDPGNLVPLCHECHVKTHKEMGRGDKETRKKRHEERNADAIARLFGD